MCVHRRRFPTPTIGSQAQIASTSPDPINAVINVVVSFPDIVAVGTFLFPGKQCPARNFHRPDTLAERTLGTAYNNNTSARISPGAAAGSLGRANGRPGK